jgi:hypothetical protein
MLVCCSQERGYMTFSEMTFSMTFSITTLIIKLVYVTLSTNDTHYNSALA